VPGRLTRGVYSEVRAIRIRFAELAFLTVAAFGVPSGGCDASARSQGADSAGDGGSAGGAGTTGGAGEAGTTGNVGSAGGAATPGPGAAGTTGSGSAGKVGSGGAGATGSNMGTGGFDTGSLFTDAAAAVIPSTDAGTSSPETSTPGPDASGPPGNGNTGTCHIGGLGIAAVFTQKGTDVTVVVTATNCAQGNHTLQIRGGFSCDNASTEGPVWDGKRGDGIPPLVCSGNKGTLTYTRSGADPTTNWTVGDHSTKTDVTLHPMSADTSCGTFF
jgi:hypothetical protein